MNKEEAKAAHERAVFRDFAAAARLPVVPHSIESRRPPEPDILCELAEGGRVAFEVGAHRTGPGVSVISVKEGPRDVGGDRRSRGFERS